MVRPRTLLLATTNRGKLGEVRAVLVSLPVHVVTLDELREPIPEPVEDADTFEGNATIKALHYARLAKCWALTDDSGLEVDALDGAPGVHSSRYAGPGGAAAGRSTSPGIWPSSTIPPASRKPTTRLFQF